MKEAAESVCASTRVRVCEHVCTCVHTFWGVSAPALEVDKSQSKAGVGWSIPGTGKQGPGKPSTCHTPASHLGEGGLGRSRSGPTQSACPRLSRSPSVHTGQACSLGGPGPPPAPPRATPRCKARHSQHKQAGPRPPRASPPFLTHRPGNRCVKTNSRNLVLLQSPETPGSQLPAERALPCVLRGSWPTRCARVSV